MKRIFRTGGAAAVGLLALWLMGCHAKFDMKITVDKALEDPKSKMMPSIEVHLCPVWSEQEYKTMMETDMTAYWDKYRKTGVVPPGTKIVKLGANTATATIGQNDKVWAEWDRQKARNLFVLSNYPLPIAADPERGRGPRRIALPLNVNSWPNYHWGKEELPIVIKPWPAGVQCLRDFDRSPASFPYERVLDVGLRLIMR